MNHTMIRHKDCGGVLDYFTSLNGVTAETYAVCFTCGSQWYKLGNPPVFEREVDPCAEGYRQIEEGDSAP